MDAVGADELQSAKPILRPVHTHRVHLNYRLVLHLPLRHVVALCGQQRHSQLALDAEAPVVDVRAGGSLLRVPEEWSMSIVRKPALRTDGLV